jgi:transposase
MNGSSLSGESRTGIACRTGGWREQHPALALIYRLKQHLCNLLLKKHRTRTQCRRLIPRLLTATLGETLHTWQTEIATMRRFTRKDGITEGFHTRMEVLQRQAHGFRNFKSYRVRVRVLCCRRFRRRNCPH